MKKFPKRKDINVNLFILLLSNTPNMAGLLPVVVTIVILRHFIDLFH